MVIFSDIANEFMILDYSPTHSQLLVRSMRNNNRDYNIDIVIKGVANLIVPSRFYGLEISLLEPGSDLNQLVKMFNFNVNKDYRVFSINSSGRRYYINAMVFGVYFNRVPPNESSLGRYDFGDLGEKILWFSE